MEKQQQKKVHSQQTNSVIRTLRLLEVLRESTDENHPLTQAEILKLLKEKDDTCTEKTLNEGLNRLMEYLNPPYFTEENKGEFRILYAGIEEGRKRKTDIYYVPLLSDKELDAVIDALKFSRSLGTAEAETIIDKVKTLGRGGYRRDTDLIQNVPENTPIDRTGMSEKLEVIQRAIRDKVQISFLFNGYDREGHLEPTKLWSDPAKDKRYYISPYYIVAYNNKYYCLSNTAPYDNTSIYRIDLMTELGIPMPEPTEKPHGRTGRTKGIPAKDVRKVEGLPKPWELDHFMREHMNMFYDRPHMVVLRIHREGYTMLREWFGNHYTFKRELDPEHDEVEVTCSHNAMVNWAIQYSDKVEVLRPKSLREKIAEKLRDTARMYGTTVED